MRITYQMNHDFCAGIMPNVLEEAIEWIRDRCDPQDVFPESDLIAWAQDNGFVEASNG